MFGADLLTTTSDYVSIVGGVIAILLGVGSLIKGIQTFLANRRAMVTPVVKTSDEPDLEPETPTTPKIPIYTMADMRRLSRPYPTSAPKPRHQYDEWFDDLSVSRIQFRLSFLIPLLVLVWIAAIVIALIH